MVKNNTHRLLELDALRGIAAIFVVCYHISMGRQPYSSFFHLGLTGVELFFIISGFVIFMTLEKIKSPKEFVISRLTRLYPTYWTCVTITSVLVLLSNFDHLSLRFMIKYIANMTMFPTYFHQLNMDGPYWTMLVEMIFYILMLLIFSIKRLRQIELIGTVLLIPLLIYGLCPFGYIEAYSMRINRFCGLLNYFPLFFSGIIYYKIKFSSPSKYRFMLLAFCFATQVLLFHTTGGRVTAISLYEYAAMLILYNAVFILYVNNKLGIIVNNFTVFIGGISFPLYLSHQFVSTIVIMPYLIRYCNFWLAAIADLFIVIGLAYLVNKFVEKPALVYFRNRWLKR